jgi:hypothetical protein
MTTSTITWHKPTALPDADTAVLVGLDVDGIRTSCEGYFGCNPDGREFWYDSNDQPLDSKHVTGWCELPEGPAK